ncbi:hypothetical protein CDAR_516621 [Caerostris darwini]|uniref:Uncharacterized protein n=1 Tax=Caerostris darwini TaxID=1538125 RepID=A0AAV4WSS9_9ARAC|nr:hypothetical protein CDAR_516621 [Caerostris darwini]
MNPDDARKQLQSMLETLREEYSCHTVGCIKNHKQTLIKRTASPTTLEDGIITNHKQALNKRTASPTTLEDGIITNHKQALNKRTVSPTTLEDGIITPTKNTFLVARKAHHQ